MNVDPCNGCSLCVMGCANFLQLADESLTAQARNVYLQSKGSVSALKENLNHCVQSGYCTAVCPRDVPNDQNFKKLMNQLNGLDRQVFVENFRKGQSLYGQPLKLAQAQGKYALGGDQYSLKLGCTFLHDHSHRLPLLKSVCEKYQLPFYLKENESCCARFLEDNGFEEEFKKACFETRQGQATVHLDASCAHKSDHSFWDFLFQKERFPFLEGESLYVSSRWLNAQPAYRIRLLEKFVSKTSIKPLNQEGMKRATGGVKSSWRSRLSLEIPLENDVPNGALVMEVSEISGDNQWLLEVL